MSISENLLIFDCDGVLVDSEVLAVKAEESVLADAGFPMTAAEIVDSCVGLSDAAMIALLEERFSKPVPDGLAQKLKEEAISLFPTELREVPGMSDFLSSSDQPRCIASSGTPERIALSLGITKLDELFAADAIISATMVVNGKPAPDLFLHAASQMGFAPQNCIVIEDSPHGVAAARAAGMDVVALTAGGHMGEGILAKLTAAEPTLTVATTGELALAIEQLTAN